jgi:hypothetical protein
LEAHANTQPVARTHSNEKQEGKRSRKRRRYGGAPVIASVPGTGAIRAARFAVFFTVVAWMAYLIEQTVRLDNTEITTRNLAETAVYALLVTLLAASATAYLLARIGYLERIKVHRRQPRSTIDD